MPAPREILDIPGFYYAEGVRFQSLVKMVKQGNLVLCLFALQKAT
jgi:hypothetical protein